MFRRDHQPPRRPQSPDPTPERSGGALGPIGRVARRTAGPVVLVWLVVQAVIWKLSHYLTATRSIATNTAIEEALQLTHRHWYAVFGAHALGLLAIIGFDAGSTAATLASLTGFLAGRYLQWLVVLTAYLTIDPRTD